MIRRSYAITGMPASFAWLITVPSELPSMEAITKTSTPSVIMFSIWDTCVAVSLDAYWISTLYPAASSSACMFEPSWFQRCRSFVGIATPTNPPSPALALSSAAALSSAVSVAAASVAALSSVAALLPQPTNREATIAVLSNTLNNFFFILKSSLN